jgi:hypothetical protein
MCTMNVEQRERLIALINNPPAGSKIAEAKEYGIDLTLLAEILAMTPTERIRALDRAQPLLEELSKAAKRVPK